MRIDPKHWSDLIFYIWSSFQVRTLTYRNSIWHNKHLFKVCPLFLLRFHNLQISIWTDSQSTVTPISTLFSLYLHRTRWCWMLVVELESSPCLLPGLGPPRYNSDVILMFFHLCSFGTRTYRYLNKPSIPIFFKGQLNVRFIVRWA